MEPFQAISVISSASLYTFSDQILGKKICAAKAIPVIAMRMEPKFLPKKSSLFADESADAPPPKPPKRGIFNFLRGALRGGTGTLDILLKTLIYKSSDFVRILIFFWY